MFKSQLGVALLCLFTTTISLTLSQELFAQTITPRTIAELSIIMRESSGIVTTGKEGFWTINDGTNGARLHAADTSGNVYRTINLTNASNYDWEDMTTDPDGNMYIADTGDKNAAYSPSQAYDDLSIYKIPNPDYHCDNNVTAEIIHLRFPDNSGVDNAESIFYHENYLYIVTKSDDTSGPNAGKAELYRVSANPNTLQQQYVAEYITEMDISPPGVALDYYQVSAAELSPDGKLLVMVGETRLWIIQNFTEGVFFDGQVSTFDFSKRLQRESVDFVGNREIYITDEDEQVASAEDGTLAYLNLCPYVNEANGCSQNFGVARSQANVYYNSAVESSTGQVTTQGSTIAMGSSRKTALRFDDINVPQGAKITNAYIQFKASSTSSVANSMTLYGEASGNAATFNTGYQNISNREKTHQSVSWSFGTWISNQTKKVQRTPDISKVIQEIVSQDNWNNYNALALIMEGTGTRIAYSENNCNRAAPELIVEYYEPLKLDIKAWIEGAYDKETNSMKTNMNNLRVLPGQINTVSGQPYSTPAWNYDGEEGKYYEAGDYAANVVEWVLVSLRSTPASSSTVARTAALLNSNGTVKQVIPYELSTNTTGNFYIVVQHRNHLPAMSHIPVSVNNGVLSYNFTTQNSYTVPTKSGQKFLEPGAWALYAGDGDKLSDNLGYDINGADKIPFQQNNGFNYIYLQADYNLDGDVTGADKANWTFNNGVSSAVPK